MPSFPSRPDGPVGPGGPGINRIDFLELDEWDELVLELDELELDFDEHVLSVSLELEDSERLNCPSHPQRSDELERLPRLRRLPQ